MALWLGSLGHTKDITRFVAQEERSWVNSGSGLIRPEDLNQVTEDVFPMKNELMAKMIVCRTMTL